MISHEELDVAKRRVEIDEIDALELDLEAITDLDDVMRRPPRVALQHVAARLGVDVGSPRLEHAGRGVAQDDPRGLEQMMAAALRLLAEGALAGQALDPHLEQQEIL